MFVFILTILDIFGPYGAKHSSKYLTCIYLLELKLRTLIVAFKTNQKYTIIFFIIKQKCLLIFMEIKRNIYF